MKKNITPFLIILAFSLFCGMLVMTQGFGDIHGPLNAFGRPLVCADGVLQVESQTYSSPAPGQSAIVYTAYCLDSQTGNERDVTSELRDANTKAKWILAGLTAAIVFAATLAFLGRAARRLGIPFEDLFQPSVERGNK